MLHVYSKPNCLQCDKLKALLDSQYDEPYTVHDITADPSKREFLISQGHRAVPQVYDDQGAYVGDFQTLQKKLTGK